MDDCIRTSCTAHHGHSCKWRPNPLKISLRAHDYQDHPLFTCRPAWPWSGGSSGRPGTRAPGTPGAQLGHMRGAKLQGQVARRPAAGWLAHPRPAHQHFPNAPPAPAPRKTKPSPPTWKNVVTKSSTVPLATSLSLSSVVSTFSGRTSLLLKTSAAAAGRAGEGEV